MSVTEQQGSGQVFWTGYDSEGNIWLSCQFQLPVRFDKADRPEETLLKQLFQEALKQNPGALNLRADYDIKTYLEFPRLWGLGSSSTMIYNLAQWLYVDPYSLLQKTMGGSGYDLACAGNTKPLLYQLDHGKPMVQTVDFNPLFTDRLYFVYLNQKQTSSKEIKQYKDRKTDKQLAVSSVNELTQSILKAQNLEAFNQLLKAHESLLATVLNRPVVQEHFPDFDGQLKSLGAWGGDFILASGGTDTVNYFKSKGYDTVIAYQKMVMT